MLSEEGFEGDNEDRHSDMELQILKLKLQYLDLAQLKNLAIPMVQSRMGTVEAVLEEENIVEVQQGDVIVLQVVNKQDTQVAMVEPEDVDVEDITKDRVNVNSNQQLQIFHSHSQVTEYCNCCHFAVINCCH